MLATTFLFGLMGSFHCTLMCGPLAGMACGLGPKQSAWSYHLARIGTYTVLGCAASLVTALLIHLSLTHWLASSSVFLGVAFGSVVFLYAMLNLLLHLAPKTPRSKKSKWYKILAALTSPAPGKGSDRVRAFFGRSPFPKSISLGIMTGFLPCGFLYAALAQAALHAHPVFGGLSMMLFAIASTPALALGGGLIAWAYLHAPRLTPLLIPLLIAASGALIIYRSTHPHQHHDHGAMHHEQGNE